MKKTKIILLSALVTVALFAPITGCKRSDDNYYGDVAFWSEINEDITVIVDDSYVRDIITSNTGYDCDQAGLASFTLSPGSHHYRAHTSSYSVTWPETSFYVTENFCLLKHL